MLKGAADDAAGGLFYRGKVNGIAGESGCGKTFTALAAASQELSEGRSVLYVDLEDDAAGIVGRLLSMGTDPQEIVRGLHYVSPNERLSTSALNYLSAVLDAASPSLAVIDSTGEGLSLEGANPNADEEVALWFRRLPRRLATHPARPAVAVLDHVTKADDSGLWPIGSQRKRAAIDGAQYMQRTVRAFAQGVPGAAVLICAKDRGGNYRVGQKVAELTVSPPIGITDEAVELDAGVQVVLVAVADNRPTDGAAFRPTELMERVSLYLEGHPGAADRTGRRIREGVKGKNTAVLHAADVLVIEEYVKTSPGPNSATIYELLRPFRKADDSGPPSVEKASVTGSPRGTGRGGEIHASN